MTALGDALVRELLAALRDDATLRAELRALLDVEEPERRRDEPRWLSLDEAAQRLNVSRRTAERLVAAGRLPTVTVGRRRLVRARDLDAAVLCDVDLRAR